MTNNNKSEHSNESEHSNSKSDFDTEMDALLDNIEILAKKKAIEYKPKALSFIASINRILTKHIGK